MKIFKFLLDDVARFGILEESGRVRLSKTSPFEGDMVLEEGSLALETLKLLPPTSDHPRIFGIGLNYKTHIQETGRSNPEIPSIFMKPDTALIGDGENIVYPSGSSVVHHEAEMVIVIGRKARNVRRQDAAHHVLGFTCGNDVSERTIQRQEMASGVMTIGKAFDTFAPVGPCIATGLDSTRLKLVGRLNGKTVQACELSDLLFGVDALVEYISRAVTLQPGDLILTGTPGGVGPLPPGRRIPGRD